MVMLKLSAFMLTLGEYEVNGTGFLIIALGGIALFLPFWFLRDWFLQRWRIKHTKITVKYEPPSGLSPAEMQHLFGSLPFERTLAATLVSMLHQSYIHIEVKGERKLFKLGPKSSASANSYEKLVLEHMGEHGVTFDDLASSMASDATARAFRRGVHDVLREKKLIAGKQVNQFFIRSLKITIVLLLTVVWWPLFVFALVHTLSVSVSDFSSIADFASYGATYSAILLLPLIIASVFVMKYRSQLLGRRWMATPKLDRQWPQIIGFREFTVHCYRSKLKFSSDELSKKARISILPYAIAFGAARNWRDIVS